MTEGSTAAVAPVLELLPYQSRLVEFLKRHEADVWNWFASSTRRASHAEELRFDLLKSTYRIDRDSQPELYEHADRVAGQLGLAVPITLYQAQDPLGLNASLVYFPDEIHIVLHGPIARQLNAIELSGLLGHECAHFLLWQGWHGDLMIAEQLLSAFTNDRRAHPAHFATARLLRLYNEIVCDRGAWLVTQDMRAVVSMLVKVQTGVQEINPDSYLKQADEILARGPTRMEGVSHPDAYIRARAIRLWSEKDPQADAAIAEMIEARTELQELDLLGQQWIAGWTRRMVDRLLERSWFQTDLVLAHARLYFDDYSWPTAPSDASALQGVRLDTGSMRDYACFVLLDFVSADRELDEPSLAAALALAEELGIKERFVELARQELRLRKNSLEAVDRNKEKILREADQSAAASS